MEQYLKLIKKELIKNEFGQQMPIETITTVIANSKSVTRSEFYAAMDTFLPEIVFVVKGYEYDGQQEVETEDGKRYKVIRTYRGGDGRANEIKRRQSMFENVELICQSKT